MESGIIEEILKSHEDLLKRMQGHMERAAAKRGPSMETVVKEKEELLAHLKERVEAATRAKEAAVSRFDRQIRHYSDEITRLTRELRQDKKALGRAAERPAGESGGRKRGRRADEGGMA